MTHQTDAFFTVLVPTLNEEQHIESCLRELLAQVPSGGGEVLLIDGGSTDDTIVIAEKLASHYPALRVVHNPGRLQSVACNLGAKIADARSTAFVRADAHSFYPPHFLNACLVALRTQDATSVVVPMKTLGKTRLQRAIAAAQNSILGNGGSRHRRSGASGYVDHGHHAAFDRNFFQALGGYDETFTHNEDAELDVRAAAAGGRIWLCADAAIGYYPRSTYKALACQYFRHGAGRARTLLKQRRRPRLRQVLPIGVLFALIIAPAGILQPIFLVPLGCYLVVCLSSSLILAVDGQDISILAAGPAVAVMHSSWAIGFVMTLFKAALGSRFFSH